MPIVESGFVIFISVAHLTAPANSWFKLSYLRRDVFGEGCFISALIFVACGSSLIKFSDLTRMIEEFVEQFSRYSFSEGVKCSN